MKSLKNRSLCIIITIFALCISMFSGISVKAASQNKINTYGRFKSFQLEFDKVITTEDIENSSILVLDQYDNKVNVSIEKGEDKNSIYIYPPRYGYSTTKTYRMYIDAGFKGSKYTKGYKIEEFKVDSVEVLEDISSTIYVGDEYTLPETVEAVMNDESVKQLEVDWDKEYVNSDEAKEVKIKGSLKDYNKSVYISISIKERSKKGNTDGNNRNGGFVVEDGEWIFYVKDKNLYKVKRDGTEKMQLCDDNPSSIQVYKENIIYKNGYDNCIYYIRYDGSKKDKYIDFGIMSYCIEDTKLYYSTKSKNRIYDAYMLRRRDLKSGKDYLMFSEVKQGGYDNFEMQPFNVCVLEDKVIFRDGYNNGDQIRAMKSDYEYDYSTYFNSNDIESLINDQSYCINVVQDGVFYIKGGNQYIYKVNSYGSGKTQMSNVKARSLNVYGNYIFYVNEEDNYRIYKISINSKKPTKGIRVCSDSLKDNAKINVIRDWIYYYQNSELYRIKHDGSGKEKVE